MEAITNLLEKFVVFFVMRTGATHPDNVKERTQVLWMVPKNDYFLRFNCRIASLLTVMNGYGGKLNQNDIFFFKKFQPTAILSVFLPTKLSPPQFPHIILFYASHPPSPLHLHLSAL